MLVLGDEARSAVGSIGLVTEGSGENGVGFVVVEVDWCWVFGGGFMWEACL